MCVSCFERWVVCGGFLYKRGKGAAFTSGVKHMALWGQQCGSEQEGDLWGNVVLLCLVYLLGSNFCISQENLNLTGLAGLKRVSSWTSYGLKKGLGYFQVLGCHRPSYFQFMLISFVSEEFLSLAGCTCGSESWQHVTCWQIVEDVFVASLRQSSVTVVIIRGWKLSKGKCRAFFLYLCL